MYSDNKGTSIEHVEEDVEVDDEEENDDEDDPEVYEVEEILEVCYGDPNEKGCPELHFKVVGTPYVLQTSIFSIFHEMTVSNILFLRSSFDILQFF